MQCAASPRSATRPFDHSFAPFRSYRVVWTIASAFVLSIAADITSVVSVNMPRKCRARSSGVSKTIAGSGKRVVPNIGCPRPSRAVASATGPDPSALGGSGFPARRPAGRSPSRRTGRTAARSRNRATRRVRGRVGGQRVVHVGVGVRRIRQASENVCAPSSLFLVPEHRRAHLRVASVRAYHAHARAHGGRRGRARARRREGERDAVSFVVAHGLERVSQKNSPGFESCAKRVGEPRPGDADLRRQIHALGPPRDVDGEQLLRLGRARIEPLDRDGVDRRARRDDARARLGIDALQVLKAVRPDEHRDARRSKRLPLLEHAHVVALALQRESRGEAAGAGAHDRHVAHVARVIHRRRRGFGGARLRGGRSRDER